MEAGILRRSWIITSLLTLFLFLLNLYVSRDLFRVEYLSAMSSIEGAFIGMSRYIMAHWNDLTWFALWNAGTPFPTTYPPLLPLVVAMAAAVSGASPAHAYHWVTALAFCMGPVALFALTWRLSGSRWAGFAAGLIYSSASPSYWFFPYMVHDLGSPFYSRRLQALTVYGEGPHVTSIALLTLAMLCLDLAMARKSAPYVALASVAFAATALTNWLGAFAILLAVVPYVLANLGRSGWTRGDLARLALIGGAAYGLAIPLMPPSTIGVLQANAGTTGGNYTHAYQAALPQGLVIVAALVVIKLAVRRFSRHLQFATLFAFLVTLIAVADGRWHIAILPMAVRYHLEMEMTLALLVAVSAHAILEHRPVWMPRAALAALVLALVWPVWQERQQARVMLRPLDITQTIEWRTAHWLNEHWTGERVFVPGSVGFWLAAFSNTPQIWGFEQATTSPVIRAAIYAIYNGDPKGVHETDSALLWMKALGVHAVEVGGPASTEAYKPFRHPERFEGVLEPIWREGDNVLYRVGEHAGLARVVPLTALVSRTPVDGLDLDPLRPYVAALDDQQMPPADFRWTSAHSASISTTLSPGDVVSVQEAWARGWHATVNGRSTPVHRDSLGLMYVDPGTSGPCSIQMNYDGGAERFTTRWLCILTAVWLMAASVRSALRKP